MSKLKKAINKKMFQSHEEDEKYQTQYKNQYKDEDFIAYNIVNKRGVRNKR